MKFDVSNCQHFASQPVKNNFLNVYKGEEILFSVKLTL